MKYIFELTSKIKKTVSLFEKHHEVIEGLKSISTPWGLEAGEYPAPEFGIGLTAIFSLNKKLKQGIKGEVIYGYREGMTIQNDDKMFIEFNPKKIDYEYLVQDVFRNYIDFFCPYEASIYNQEVIYYDYENRNTTDLATFFRFHPVFYWNEEYCFRNLKISLAEFKARISGNVRYADFFNNGIIVIVDFNLATLTAANEIDRNLKSLFFS